MRSNISIYSQVPAHFVYPQSLKNLLSSEKMDLFIGIF